MLSAIRWTKCVYINWKYLQTKYPQKTQPDITYSPISCIPNGEHIVQHDPCAVFIPILVPRPVWFLRKQTPWVAKQRSHDMNSYSYGSLLFFPWNAALHITRCFLLCFLIVTIIGQRNKQNSTTNSIVGSNLITVKRKAWAAGWGSFVTQVRPSRFTFVHYCDKLASEHY